MRPPRKWQAAAALAMTAAAAGAETAADLPRVEVTVTREAEDVSRVPAMLSVVTADELAARGAHDLRSALALLAGVEGTAGGDVGPAGTVPALWGLREADAFLLVVDGIPWGGAFNPATASVDLTNVDRIEVLRGPAPVIYGATSFVGVIHVVHRAAEQRGGSGSVEVGAPGGGGGAVSSALPALGVWQQSLTADVDRQRDAADRTGADRGHLLYRGAATADGVRTHVDIDVSDVRQLPAGNLLLADHGQLHTEFSPDSNFNPAGAHLDGQRWQAAVGLNGVAGDWGVTLAVTRSLDNLLRGYLRGDAFSLPPDAGVGDGLQADGYTQKRAITDLYFDAYVVRPVGPARLTLGLSHLHGSGAEHAINFAYCVDAGGNEYACPGAHHDDEIVRSQNTRDFSGAYAQADGSAGPYDVIAGVRLDHTAERASGYAIDNTGAAPVVSFDGRDADHHTRLSGSVGVSRRVWSEGRDTVRLYADARTSFKPLATDFGPEAEVTVLKPETGRSLEAGIKSVLWSGRVDLEGSLFRLDLANGLTYGPTPDGYGAVNGGENRYQGLEVESRWRLGNGFAVDASLAHHSARVQRASDAVGASLAGRAVPMSPDNLAAAGVRWSDAAGHAAALTAAWSDTRWLDPENTLRAPAYATLDAQLGGPLGRGRWRLTGTNLTDRRDPASASELQQSVTATGTAGWYRLPSRQVRVGIDWPF